MIDDWLAGVQARFAEPFFRHWRWMLVAVWLLYVGFIIVNRWHLIQAFALPGYRR